MKTLLLIGSILLLYITPPASQSQPSQAEPYGFQDIHLGMSITEFRTKHPAAKFENGALASPLLAGQASCVIGLDSGMREKRPEDLAKGIVECGYGAEPIPGIPLRIDAMFIDGKLAVIYVKTPGDDSGCLDPPSSGPDLSFYLNHCGRYPLLWQFFTDKLGPGTTVVEGKPQPRYHALRWETDTSVAEFQNHECGPFIVWPVGQRGRGWGKAISEVLEGMYCAPGDSLSARQPTMLYLHKELGRALANRLKEVASP